MGLASLKVMIVDDDEFDAKMLTRALLAKEQALSIYWSPSVEHAKQLLEEQVVVENSFSSPYMIFLDISMFGRKLGFELLAELRDHKLLCKSIVFMLSTSDDRSDINRAYELNASGYFSKQNVGDDYNKLIAFVEQYCNINEFPSAL